MVDGRGCTTLAHIINAVYEPGTTEAQRAKWPELNVGMRGASKGTVTYGADVRDIVEGEALAIEYGADYWDARTGGFGAGSAWWGQDVPGARDVVQYGVVRREGWEAEQEIPVPEEEVWVGIDVSAVCVAVVGVL